MSRLQVYVLPKTPCGAPNPRRPPHHSHTRPSLHKTAKPTTPPNRSRTEPPSPRPSGRDPPRPPKPAHPSPPSPLPPHSPRLPRHQMSSPPRRSPRSSSAGPSSSAVNHCSSPRTQSTAPRRPHPRAHRRLRSPQPRHHPPLRRWAYVERSACTLRTPMRGFARCCLTHLETCLRMGLTTQRDAAGTSSAMRWDALGTDTGRGAPTFPARAYGPPPPVASPRGCRRGEACRRGC